MELAKKFNNMFRVLFFEVPMSQKMKKRKLELKKLKNNGQQKGLKSKMVKWRIMIKVLKINIYGYICEIKWETHFGA